MMQLPIRTQIKNQKDPVVHWGVHFLHEDVVSDYGPGEDAKAAAEETVKHWADSPYPAQLVSQVILPWSPESNSKIPLVLEMLKAENDPRAVRCLRDWLVNNGYEDYQNHIRTPRTNLREQVPLVKAVRRSTSVTHGLNALNQWLGVHGYEPIQ